MTDIFEVATREKYRFATDRGFITTEDLWDLPLEQLNQIAVAISRQVRASQEETFLKKSKTNKRLDSHLEVLVKIIQYKEEQEELKEVETLRKAELDKRLELIDRKQYEELSARDVEDLKREYQELAKLSPQEFREKLKQG